MLRCTRATFSSSPSRRGNGSRRGLLKGRGETGCDIMETMCGTFSSAGSRPETDMAPSQRREATVICQ
eukprot:3566141-Rhodomonas_salina.1